MRSRYTTSGGIVLRRQSQPNGDALVTLLSRTGKWRALARAGRSSAGNVGRLSLFNDVSVQFYRRREQDLPIITQVTLNGMLPALSEPGLYPLAHYLAELCDALTVEVDYGEPLYEYLASGLRGLCRSDDPEKVALMYAWGMLRVAGLAPRVASCGNCGAVEGLHRLDIAGGSLSCGDCQSGRPLSATTALELRELLSSSLRDAFALSLVNRDEQWRILNSYLDFHVRRLKTSEVSAPLKRPAPHA